MESGNNVEYEEEWYKAKILDKNENDEFLVHYIADRTEEWVTDDRIRELE